MTTLMHLLMYVISFGAMLALFGSVLGLAGWLLVTCWRIVRRPFLRDLPDDTTPRPAANQDTLRDTSPATVV